MYIPKHYLEEDWEQIVYLIKNYPLATVVTSSENGIIANHIPFILEEDGDKKYLRAHIAKANHQVPSLKENDHVLIIFQSHDSYITPSYYATKKETHKVVPTWDFASVHIYGKSRIIDDPKYVRDQLNALTNQQEKNRDIPWSVDEAPESYVNLIQKAITGLQIDIERTECKFKFDQKMKKQDINGVIEGLKSDNKPEMSDLVKSANERAEKNSK